MERNKVDREDRDTHKKERCQVLTIGSGFLMITMISVNISPFWKDIN